MRSDASSSPPDCSTAPLRRSRNSAAVSSTYLMCTTRLAPARSSATPFSRTLRIPVESLPPTTRRARAAEPSDLRCSSAVAARDDPPGTTRPCASPSARRAVLRIHFHRVDKLAPRVRPTSHVHHLLPANAVVSLISVSLQNSFPLTQKLAWTLPTSAQAELEHRFSTRLAVLPPVSLMIRAPFVVHLHGHRGFIRL